MTQKDLLNKALFGILGLLLAGNLYFITDFLNDFKEQKKSLERYYDMARDVRQGLAVLEYRVDTISKRIK